MSGSATQICSTRGVPELELGDDDIILEEMMIDEPTNNCRRRMIVE